MYVNPYRNLTGGTWLKTNFHTHAGTGPNTCGSNSIDDVLRVYRQLNYDALCISNHDLYTDTTNTESHGMYLIQGVEYSAEPHMLTVGVKASLRELSHQDAISETARHGGFTVLCHPNWIVKEYWKWGELDKLSGFAGIEIINMLIYRLSGSGLATDTWDYLLKQGRLIWGFGDDDFHIFGDAGRSFTHIYAQSKDYHGIYTAVKSGSFTASTGLYLDYLTLDDSTVTVKAKFPIQTYIDTFTYRFVTNEGLAKTITGKEAQFTLTNERYVRVEVIAENGAMLFTQPVYDAEAF